MTNIIVGQNINGSLTSTNPTIIDPTSPFNGQFYDDFDLSSVSIIDNSLFLLAAGKELGDIASVKIGETRSTNIFVQPPAGSAPDASTVIQLIDTKTNSVAAQAISSSSEALTFVKNAEISGSDYKIRVINATPGDYQISLAGAIQAVQVVGTTGTNPVEGAAPIGPTVDPIPEIDPTLIGVDPVIFQNMAGGDQSAFPVALADNQPNPVSGTNPLPNARSPINPEIAIEPLPPFPSTRSENFLQARFVTTGFSISAISQKPSSKVNEIGVFVVDNDTGEINGIAPGAAGYLKAAINSARSIFSTLGGNFFESSSKREIALAQNTYGFFEVQDGSIADVKQQLANGQTPTNVLFSTPGLNGVIPIQLTDNDTSTFNFSYNLSVNKDELVLKVTSLDGISSSVIGAKSQGLAEGRTIDLTGLTGTLKADIETKSSAAYTNNIGFYKVEDSIGTIKLIDGKTVKPGDPNYAVEAIKNALANSSLQAGKTESKLGQDIAGGFLYAPVVVAQGSLSDFITTNSTNNGGSSINAYFNYVGANSDGKDHFRLLGDNTFGVEDQYDGGDRDFNDLVVNVKFK